MRGIKVPQYEFALKMQGGLMRKGERICGTLRYHSPGKISIHTDHHLYIGHTHTYLPQGRVSFYEGLCMCGRPA